MANPFPELRAFDDRPPAPGPMNAESWLEREMRAERTNQLRVVIDNAPPPDKVARETRVARQAGVSPLEVGDVDRAERAMQARSFLELSSSHSAIAQWALNNPRGAAAAQDDTESLGLLGNAWEGLENVGNRLLAGTSESTAGLVEGLGTMEWSPDPVWRLAGELLKPVSRAGAAQIRGQAAGFREAGRAENWWAEAALSGLESVPIVAVSALTKNPTLATAIPSLSVYGNAAAEGRRQGLSETQARLYGGLQGGIEFATERLPMGILADAVAKRTPFGRAFARQLAAELPGEQVATILQDLTDWAMLPENENKSFNDYLAERPVAALQTAVATVSGTASQTALARSLQGAADATIKVAERVGEVRQARREREFIDRAEKAVTQSKLKERDPEAFRALVRNQAEEAGATHAFIPGEAIRAYQQSDSYDRQDDPFARFDTAEAISTGGDVVVPIEDLLTDIVGTPAWQAVKDDIRLNPGGMSAREAQTFDEAMDDVMAELAKETAEREAGDAAQRTVRETLVDKVAAMFGDSFTAPVARQYAELAVSRAQTRAERLGTQLQGDEFDTLAVRQDMGEVAEGGRAFTQDRETGQEADPAITRIAAQVRRVGEQLGLTPQEAAEVGDAVSAEARALEQSDMSDGARGRIIFDQNQRIIELFQGRNLSTPLHELSHMWLEELRFDAEQKGAPKQLKADWQTVKRYFAANGHKIGKDGVIPVEAHELWARSGERYFMEGKAPSSALTRLFEAFRGWLVNIYRTVDSLRAPITPEIREVFDRLLATDEEIAAASDRQAIAALFKDAASIGMSEAEFSAYQQQVDDARADAHAKLIDKTLKTVRRREETRYREARKTIREEEIERIDNSPVFRAIASMRDQRVSQEWIVEEMGEDALNLLPVRVPPLYVEGGAHPDVLAELSGYRSGKEMIEALIGAEAAHRQAKEGGDKRSMCERAIETATNEEFARRFGDPLNDGSPEREALAAVHSDMQGEVIASEIRVLARRTGNRPTPYALAKEFARRKIRGGIVRDEASPGAIQRYARNAAKAGRAAEQAMLKQDIAETYRQKQFQMINNALLSEAKAAADEVDAAVKRMDRIARAKTRKSVDQDYLEQAHALLEAVDLRERSQVGIDRQGKWEEWARSREAEGFDIVVPASFEATLGKTNWSRLSVENLLALDETVKQIIHLGRLKQSLLDNQEEREWDEIYREAEAGGDIIGRKPPKGSFTEPGWWDSIKHRVLAADAALLKMETVFDWLDNGNSNGVFNRIAFRPLAEAQAREQAMLTDYYGRIREAMQNVPPESVKRWGDKVTLDLIDPETGLPAVMTRQKIVAMALNWGNAGNRQRLADGYGWSQPGIEAALMENLSEAEWKFVQEVWDIIDTLWPDIEKMERAVNGVAPERVEAVEVVTPYGTLKGGYYPAIYDSTLDYTAEEQAGKRTDLFEALYTRATTRASSTKERMTKVSRPILLDLGVINRHLGEVIHDVTHREPVMRSWKFLTNRRVMKTVDETLGREVREQFRPWLQHIANSWAADRSGNEGIGKFMSKLRANTTVVGMGWRVSTMMTQLAGYSNSIEYVGLKHIAPAVAQFHAQMVGSAVKFVTFRGVQMPPMMAFALERSEELRHRMDTLDRDIATELRRMSQPGLAGANRTLTAAKEFAFHGIGYMDRVVSVPTWIGAYNKALAEGMSEQDARYAGDKAVRLSQGAAGAKDLAAVQRGRGSWGEAFKLMTMFYSYMSAFYQRQRRLGRDVRRASPKDLPNLIARAWWLIVVPPLLAEILSGRGPDEDDDWGWWAFRKMLAQSVGPIPLIRDIFEPAWDKATDNPSFGYRFTPAQGVGEAAIRVAGDAGNIVEGEETNRATRNTLELVGYTTGLVPGQIAAAAQFLVDVANGDADPETAKDWYTGLTKGKLPEE